MTLTIVQGSPEWLAIRCGKVTASRVSDVVAETKSGWGASRANYMAELIAERLTGVPAERYRNAIMDRGTELEPEARSAYCFHANVDVREVGFIYHPTIHQSGCSPDGCIGDDGLVEIKCPNTANAIDTLLGEPIKKSYLFQIQWQMTCTGRKWCDFVSYDPRLPGSMCLFVRRVQRDNTIIADLEKKVVEFLAEIDAKVAELTKRYGIKAAA